MKTLTNQQQENAEVRKAIAYITEATVMLDKAMKALGDDPTPYGGSRWGHECTRIWVFAGLLDELGEDIEGQLEDDET